MPQSTRSTASPTHESASAVTEEPEQYEDEDDLYDRQAIADDEEDDEMVEVTLSINRIIPGLWIGDYVASQQYDILRELGISHVIAAMRQPYNVPEGFTLHRVAIDDTDKTNILAHFEVCNDIIHSVLQKNQGILVHCQAGVSRSTTLCAAFLMHEYGYTTDEAIEKISAVRAQVSPTEFFLHQLEMYERMGCEVDPARYPEYRRFLMNFNHEDIMDGDGVPHQLYLAYYPTPAATPRDRSMSDPFRGLRMTPVEGQSRRPSFTVSMRSRTGSSHSVNSAMSRKSSSSSIRKQSRSELTMTSMPASDTDNNSLRGRRGRLASGLEMTPSVSTSQPSSASTPAQNTSGLPPNATPSSSSQPIDTREGIRDMLKQHAADQKQNSLSASQKAAQNRQAIRDEAMRLIGGQSGVLKVGQGRVTIKGRRLRCKMCRRELAAREHIVEHEPGEGQRAFAPRRRDMAQHRQDQERRRMEIEKRTQEEADKKGKENSDSDVNAAATVRDASQKSSDIVNAANLSKDTKEGSTSPAIDGLPPSSTSGTSAKRRPDLHLSLNTSPNPLDSAIDDDTDNETSNSRKSPPLLCSTLCNSYFTEPLSWMSDQLGEGSLGGRIMCPNSKCGAKLGSFDWAGLQCSCGSWVVPAFSISASKVDEI